VHGEGGGRDPLPARGPRQGPARRARGQGEGGRAPGHVRGGRPAGGGRASARGGGAGAPGQAEAPTRLTPVCRPSGATWLFRSLFKRPIVASWLLGASNAARTCATTRSGATCRSDAV